MLITTHLCALLIVTQSLKAQIDLNDVRTGIRREIRSIGRLDSYPSNMQLDDLNYFDQKEYLRVLNRLEMAAEESIDSADLVKFNEIYLTNLKNRGTPRYKHIIVPDEMIPRAAIIAMNKSILSIIKIARLSTNDGINLALLENSTNFYFAISASRYRHFEVIIFQLTQFSHNSSNTLLTIKLPHSISQLIQNTCVAVILIMIFFGNVSVLIHLRKVRRNRSNMGFFLRNLALTGK